MSKLYDKIKRKKSSKKGKRFYTLLDMAIIKHDIAVMNSKVKRKIVIKKSNNDTIYECGCGAEGCFIHTSY